MRCLILPTFLCLAISCGNSRTPEQIKENTKVLETVKTETIDPVVIAVVDTAIKENEDELDRDTGSKERTEGRSRSHEGEFNSRHGDK